MSKQKKPDAHIKIELTAEEYMKRAGEEHNRIMEEWEKNRKKPLLLELLGGNVINNNGFIKRTIKRYSYNITII